MTALSSILEDWMEHDLLDAHDVSRVLEISSRSVSRWQQDAAAPRRESEERLLELKAVVDLLLQVLRPEPARLWLRAPNPDLGYDKPLDVIRQGGYRRVIGVIQAVAEGVTA